jgi:hypothetical protein
MKVAALILAFLFWILSSCSRFQEYHPQVFNGDELVVKQDLLTDEHIKNLIQVLVYNNVDWKNENGKIYISSTVDREEMWNYTTRANDPEWLSTHK